MCYVFPIKVVLTSYYMGVETRLWLRESLQYPEQVH